MHEFERAPSGQVLAVCVCVQGGGVERVKLCVSECIGGYRAIACMHRIHTDRI